MAIGRPASQGLVAISTGRELAVAGAAHVVHRGGRPVGAALGLLDAHEAGALTDRLRVSDDPGRTAQDLPWMLCVLREDGSVAASSSMAWGSGASWALERRDDHWHLIVASDERGVIESRASATSLDRQFLREAVLGLQPESGATPYQGIRRVRSGDTLVWRPPGPDVVVRTWCGLATLDPPKRRGAQVLRDYVANFDSVVDSVVERVPADVPLCATMSAGLDSTFVVASLLRATGGARSVEALCHSPIPEAGLTQWPGRVPDDFPDAQLMEACYPGRLRVTPIRNTANLDPLTAHDRYLERSWWPVRNPTNVSWWLTAHDAAGPSGALFVGGHGNMTFSRSTHPTPVQLLAAGRVAAAGRRAAGVLRNGLRDARGKGTRVNPTAGNWAQAGVARRFDAAAGGGRDPIRARRAMVGQPAAPSPPALVRGPTPVLTVDPFRSRSIVELAAAIHPAEWHRGAPTRGFARRAGRGRVPVRISQRRTRGGQSLDAWFLVSRDLAGFRDRATRSAESEVFAGLYDLKTMSAWFDRADPNDRRHPTGFYELVRLAAFGGFVDWAGDRGIR